MSLYNFVIIISYFIGICYLHILLSCQKVPTPTSSCEYGKKKKTYDDVTEFSIQILLNFFLCISKHVYYQLLMQKKMFQVSILCKNRWGKISKVSINIYMLSLLNLLIIF